MQAPAFQRREPRGLAMRQALRRYPDVQPHHAEEAVPSSLAASAQIAGLVLGAVVGFLATALIIGLFGEGILPVTFAPVGAAATMSALVGGTLAGTSFGGLIGGLTGLALDAPPEIEEKPLPIIDTLPVPSDLDRWG
jgi:hypothetical protein